MEHSLKTYFRYKRGYYESWRIQIISTGNWISSSRGDHFSASFIKASLFYISFAQNYIKKTNYIKRIIQHPAIAECCVLGLPDKDYGDAVSAIIVAEEALKKERERDSKPALTLKELCDWAKEKLAPYKVLIQCHMSVFIFIYEITLKLGKVSF